MIAANGKGCLSDDKLPLYKMSPLSVKNKNRFEQIGIKTMSLHES